MKFLVHSIQAENHIDVTQQAYFIEDTKAAAKRCKLESVDLFGPEWNAPWYIDDEEEMLDSIADDLFKAKLKLAYEDLKKLKTLYPLKSSFHQERVEPKPR